MSISGSYCLLFDGVQRLGDTNLIDVILSLDSQLFLCFDLYPYNKEKYLKLILKPILIRCNYSKVSSANLTFLIIFIHKT